MSHAMHAIPAAMTAIGITRPGGPEVLTPVQRPVPAPAADEVLIRIHAAGVNGPDVMQRKGLYDPPPGASDIPGLRTIVIGLPLIERVAQHLNHTTLGPPPW